MIFNMDPSFLSEFLKIANLPEEKAAKFSIGWDWTAVRGVYTFYYVQKTLYWWNWISSITYVWGKTQIWIKHNLISIPPKCLGSVVLASAFWQGKWIISGFVLRWFIAKSKRLERSDMPKWWSAFRVVKRGYYFCRYCTFGLWKWTKKAKI